MVDAVSQPSSNRFTVRYWMLIVILMLVRGIAWLPYTLVYRVGQSVGYVLFYTSGKERNIAKINLKMCFPSLSDKERTVLAKESFKSIGVGMAECAMLWLGPKRFWHDKVELEGLEHYENAIKNNKGVLFLGMHLTDLEIGGCMLGLKIPLNAFYRKNENPIIEDIMTQGRRRYLNTIPRDNTLKIVRSLKAGEAVWFAPDQDYGASGAEFVPFFNIPAATITATSRYVKLTGARVIPLTQQRILKGKKIRITMHPPLAIDGSDAVQEASTINQFIEQYVRRFPENYLWVHKRFKTRPNESDPSFYPQHQGWRKVTPSSYRYLLEKAEWIEKKNGVPYKIKNYQGIIYFIYRKQHWSDMFSPPYKKFIKDLPAEVIDGREYRFQGVVRRCKFKHCDLVYLQ